MPGTLYVVASPIGNLEELSPRALKVLGEADIIAAEDTRTTGHMLGKFGIKAKLVAYHKFNELARQNFILEKLKNGENIALVSDAGTPCISDPGYLLVRAAADEGFTVVGLSGSCAVTTAISVSGFPAEPFLFVGFLPRKDGAIIKTLSRDSQTIVFYESPRRVISTVELLAEFMPEASLCLCNDLTKKYERIYRGKPSEVLEELQSNPHAEKGEYTCVLYFCAIQQIEEATSLESQLIDIMVKSNCSLKEAIKNLSATKPKNEIYAASLRLKERLKEMFK